MQQIKTLMFSHTKPVTKVAVSTYQDAYSCGKETFDSQGLSHQVLIPFLLRLIHELEQLREDERVMGHIPQIEDGYDWVLGNMAGVFAFYTSARFQADQSSVRIDRG